MAKNISNSYTGNAAGVPDLTSGYSRTNPQAHEPNNVVKLYGIRKFGGCSFSPTFTYAYDESSNELTITPTAGYNTTGLRFWKHRLMDEQGNEVYGVQASIGTNTAIVLSTATLDRKTCWRLEFEAETLVNGLHCSASWWLELPEGFGYTDHASASGQDI